MKKYHQIDDRKLEYCPYCQRWVEPTKGHTDLLAGYAFGGLLGAIVGTGHYLLKGSRCPICNNIIKGRGARGYIPPQAQIHPQPTYQHYPQPLPQYTMPSKRRHPQIPPKPSQLCPRCRQPLAWVPNLNQWYCYYCQIPVYA